MNGHPTITRMGTVTFSGGEVYVHDDWEFEEASCREATQLALTHVLGRLHDALAADLIRDKPTAIRGTPARLLGYPHEGCTECNGTGWRYTELNGERKYRQCPRPA